MRLDRYRIHAVSAVLCGGLVAIWAMDLGDVRTVARERAFDVILPHLVAPSEPQALVVVDIDRESLAQFGTWPWPRTRIAELIRAVSESKPLVLGLDILLGRIERLPPGGEPSPETESEPSTGDKAIADAARAQPTVFGLVLDDGVQAPSLPTTPIFTRGQPQLSQLWNAGAVVGPGPTIAAAAEGFGVIALSPDADGRIRRIPLLVRVGGALRPGFAVELIRVAAGAGALLIGSVPPRMNVGSIGLPLDPAAQLRIIPTGPDIWQARTISAVRVMTEPASRQRLEGRIVLIGSGAPELGGLRAGAVSAATPSVQIHADAIDMITRGLLPNRPAWMASLETGGAIVLAAIALMLSWRLRPLRAVLVMLAAALIWIVAASVAFLVGALLLDPAGPAAIAIASFSAASLAAYAENESRARALRQRFEQHLAPEIVTKLAQNPGLLRLEGELREITALFTDLEDFTAMTERINPRDLVSLLDQYLDEITRAVVAHGGMVEKIVGDAVHAIFNAPLDLADHPQRAFECAIAILAASEAVRARPLARALGLGRTRIGVESGPVIVGDVGGGRKLDYTAHGIAMNTASRLEAANKEFRSSICIGPNAAARLDPTAIRSLGRLAVRGRSEPLEVFTCADWQPSANSPHSVSS